MSYIGTEPKDIRSFGRTKFDYTATQGQTAFTGADDDGKVLAFTTGQIEVYVNGILMDDSDFTTTGTGTVTLASAANLNDVVNVVSFESNIPDNDYVPASGGTFTGAVTHTGAFTSKGIDDNADATAITIDSSENVMVGKTATNYQTVGVEAKPDGSLFATAANNGPLVATRKSSDGNIASFYKDSTNVGNIGSAGSDITIDGPSEHTGLRFEAADITPRHNGAASNNYTSLGTASSRFKDLYLGGGAYIGGTAAANKLDDYETGDWTAAFASQYGSITVNNSYKTGQYTKIGNTVHINIHIRASAISSPSGNLTITGLPFSTPNNTDYRTSLAPAIHFSMTGMGGDELILAYISNNSNVITLASQNGNNIYSAIASRVTASSELYIGGHYSV